MRLSIKTKLTATFLLLSAFIVGTTYLGVRNVNNSQANSHEIIKQQDIKVAVLEITDDQVQKVANFRAFMLYEKPIYMDEYKKITKEQEQDIARMSKLFTTEQNHQYLEKYRELSQRYDDIVQKIVEHINANDDVKAKQYSTQAAQIVTELNQLCDEWSVFINQGIDKQLKENAEKTANDKLLLYAISFAIVLLSLVVGMFMSNQIAPPLLALSQATREIAKGNLKVSLPKVKADDEIKDLADAFENMGTNLKELIKNIEIAVESINVSGSNLYTGADESSKVTQQVAIAVQEIARGANEQSQSVTVTAKNIANMNQIVGEIASGAVVQAQDVTLTVQMIDQMANAIQSVAQSARGVAETATKTKTTADQGQKAVESSIDGMNDIKDKVFEAAEKIKVLGDRSQDIGAIVQVIDDIAEQTNLLALNAAIEAARAGEHGKGFAVVADEVRKLAERSGSATKEIAALITEIQGLTTNTVKAMEEGTEKVNQGVALSEDASNALLDILTTVDDTYKQVQNISSLAQEISASSQEVVQAVYNVKTITDKNTESTKVLEVAGSDINDAIQNIAAITEQSSAATEEVSASTEEMSASIEQIAASAENLAQTAVELNEQVKKFTL